MLAVFAYVASLIAAAAGIVLLYVVCAGDDRAVVRSRSRRPMRAVLFCVVPLIAAAAGVVMLLNIAVGSGKSDKNQLVRAIPDSTVKAAGSKPVASSVAETKPVVSPAAEVIDRPKSPNQKKATARQKPKPRYAERRPDYFYSRGTERPIYNFW